MSHFDLDPMLQKEWEDNWEGEEIIKTRMTKKEGCQLSLASGAVVRITSYL